MNLNKPVAMLSIDDRSLVTDLDRAGYKQMGINVFSAASLAEARSVIQKRSIDVIVINYDYRAINWVELRGMLDTNSIDIPLVFTGVKPTPEAKKKAESLGASLFIEQPAPRKVFVEEVKKLLDRLARGEARVEVNESAKIYFGADEYSVTVKDVSGRGLLVKMDHGTIMPESKVKIDFVLSAIGKRVIASGEIIRTVEKQGEKCLALRITKFENDSEESLKSFVERSNKSEDTLKYYL